MKLALVLIGFVAVVQNVSAYSSGYVLGLGEGSGDDCRRSSRVPLVVRPQEVPKPTVTQPVSLGPVAGPCAIRKAIVKPAVLPRPQCRPSPCAVDTCHCHSSHNFHHHQSSTIVGHCDCAGPALAHLGPHSLVGSHGFGTVGSYGASGVNGANGPNGPNGPYGPGVFGPTGLRGPYGFESCRENQANCAPADAVSLSLAYKMAQQANFNSIAGEDKLNFGFRKIPKELPPKKVVENNVPEEKIFSLNGQIVELKPVRAESKKTLAEEAIEDLLDLQAEDDDIINENNNRGPKRVSLGELGYGPARHNSPTFVNVPVANAVESAVGAASEKLEKSCSCGCGCGCGCGCNSCKVIPGNVEFRTEPKPQQICIKPEVPPDSCESGEINISEEHHGCQCSCVPVCVKKCCHKKSSYTVQKFL